MQEAFPIIPALKLALPDISFIQQDLSKPYKDIFSLASHLQEVVVKQQLLINVLMIKHQQNELKLNSVLESTKKPTFHGKLEDLIMAQEHLHISTDVTSEGGETVGEDKEGNDEEKLPQIMRRNGFKTLKTLKSHKKEEFDSDGETCSSSKKMENLRKNPSKAKHLWVNYGRRIIEYGINQTKGDMQEKIKQLIGKLNSKKDFENVFQTSPNDSADEKLFKTLLGRLAIYFVKHKSGISFEGSKYRDEMIAQRHVVAAWIERLICE